MKLMTHVIGIALLLSGCGPAFLPEPSSKPVTQQNVVGLWSRQASRPMKANTPVSYTVTIDLNPDWTYSQEIRLAGQTNIVKQTGSWELDGSKVRLADLLQEEFDFEAGVGKWKPSTAYWWMTDTYDNTQPLALFGGLFGDPDSFQQFKKLR